MLNKKNLPFPDINLSVMVLSSPIPSPPPPPPTLQFHSLVPLSLPLSENRGAPLWSPSHAFSSHVPNPGHQVTEQSHRPDSSQTDNNINILIKHPTTFLSTGLLITSFTYGLCASQHQQKRDGLNASALCLSEDLKQTNAPANSGNY